MKAAQQAAFGRLFEVDDHMPGDNEIEQATWEPSEQIQRLKNYTGADGRRRVCAVGLGCEVFQAQAGRNMLEVGRRVGPPALARWRMTGSMSVARMQRMGRLPCVASRMARLYVSAPLEQPALHTRSSGCVVERLGSVLCWNTRQTAAFRKTPSR